MPGALPSSIIAKAIMIMAWKALVFLAPFLAIMILWWLVNQTDRLMNFLFPDLEWEASLGWLNIRAERRANTALRWLGYAIYLLLGAALYGIAWAAVGLQDVDNWSEPLVAGDLLLRVPVLVLSLGAWVLYLGSWLFPKIRAEREEAALKRFRIEMEEQEKERERNPRSRVNSPLRKPMINASMESPMTPISDWTRRRRLPGG